MPRHPHLAGVQQTPSRRAVTAGFAPERLEPRALLAAVAWDGEALDGDWHNPLNWAGDILPAAGDDVTIAADPSPGATLGITIAAGRSATIASLDLGKSLTLAGVLDVTGATLVRDVDLAVLPTGDLGTANLTLEQGVAAVLSEGLWTISGVSSISRPITNAGTLRVADDSSTTLGANPAAQAAPGAILAQGPVVIGDRARFTGLGTGESQLTAHATTISFGALAMLNDLAISAESPIQTFNTRLEFSDTTTTVLIGCRLDLSRITVAGNLDAARTDVILRGFVNFLGQARFDQSEIEIPGILLSSGPLAGLQVFNSHIVLGDPTVPDPDTGLIRGAARLVSTIVTLVAPATLWGPTTLIGSTIEGAFTIGIQNTLRLEGSTIGAGVEISAGPESTLVLAGDGTNTIRGVISLRGYDRAAKPLLEWSGGDVLLDGPDSTIIIGSRSLIHVRVAGEMSGTGRLEIAGGQVLDVEGDVTISAALDVRGTVLLGEGTLRLTGPIVQLVTEQATARPDTPWGFGLAQSNHLAGGKWEVRWGATLWFGRRIDWNSAQITLEDDGSIPDLGHKAIGGQLYNDGRINLQGIGNLGLMGTEYSTRIANRGRIIASNDAIWTLMGDLVNVPGAQLHVLSSSFRLVVRARTLTNSGEIFLAGSNLRVTGDFVQNAGARLLLGTGPQSFPKPAIAVGGAMSLDGKFRLDVYNSGAIPAEVFTWQAGVAKKGRTGEFRKVVMKVAPRVGQLTLLPDGFRVAVSR